MSILALEVFFTALLVIAGLAMASFAVLVVTGLYKGQR